MKHLLAFFLGALPVAAQLSPSTLSFGARVQWSTPPFQSTTVTGGTPSVGTCTGDANLCGAIQTQVTGQVVSVFFNFNYYNLSASLHTSTLPITATGACVSGCNLTVTYNNVNRQKWVFRSPSGFFSGCTTSGGFYQDLESCPPANALPGVPLATANTIPLAAGGKRIDANFGGVITQVSPTGHNRALCSDGSNTDLNADHSLVTEIGFGAENGFYVVRTDGSGTETAIPSGFNLAPNCPAWDPQNPNTLFGATGQTVITSTYPSFSGPTTIYTYPGTGGLDPSSSDNSISRSGYWALIVSPFTLGNDPVVIVLNVYTHQAWTFNYGSVATMGPNRLPGQANRVRGITTNSKGFSGTTGKMQIILQANDGGCSPNNSCSTEILNFDPVNGIVDAGPEGLNLDANYNGGGTPQLIVVPDGTLTGSGWYRGNQHSDSMETRVNGVTREFFIQPKNFNAVGQRAIAAFQTDASNTLNEVAVEAGGTELPGWPIDTGSSDMHMGCATWVPALCALSTDTDPPMTMFQVTNVAVGNPPTITSNPNYTGSNGDTLIIGGVGGVTGMPAMGASCTVAALSGASFQCSNLSTSGTYTANTGDFYNNAARSSNAHQSETFLLDFTDVNRLQVTRLWKHLSLTMNDRISGNYWSDPRSEISPDGMMICDTSNGGIPDNLIVQCGLTGYPYTHSASAAAVAGGAGTAQ